MIDIQGEATVLACRSVYGGQSAVYEVWVQGQSGFTMRFRSYNYLKPGTKWVFAAGGLTKPTTIDKLLAAAKAAP